MSQPPTPGHGQSFTPGQGAFAGRARRPATLGIIGLALVGIQLIVIIAMNQGPSVVVVTSVSGSMGQLDAGGLSVGAVLIPLAIAVVGLAGWIIGIVATVTNRGRAFGIAAIVVGVLASVITAPMMFGALLLTSLG